VPDGFALPELERVHGRIQIGPTGASAGVSLPALTTVDGTISIYFAADLPALSTVGGGLWVHRPMTAPLLQRVDGRLTLAGPLAADALVTVGGDLVVRHVDGASLPALTSARALIASVHNGTVSTLELPALTTLTAPAGFYGVNIRETRLTTLSLPALSSTPGSVAISENPALTSLALPQMTSIGPSLTVAANGALPSCYATNLLAQLEAAGWMGTSFITGNNGSGSCP
jgi:hypothetical protein